MELRYRLANNDEGGGYYADALIAWRYRDAVQRGDWAAAAEAQADGQKRTSARLAESSWYIPGSIGYMIVLEALKHGRIDDAALEIKFWSQSLAMDAVESNNAQRTNVRQLLDAKMKFLQTPQGATHNVASWMRQHVSYMAREGRNILTADNIAGLERLGLP